MENDCPALTVSSKLEDIIWVLNKIGYKNQAIPVMADTRHLKYSVQSANLREYLSKVYDKYKKVIKVDYEKD